MHEYRNLGPFRLIGLLTLWLLATAAWAQQEEDYLLPDDAFRVSADSLDAETIVVRWDIAPDYYLYRTKFTGSSDTLQLRTVSQGCADAGLCYPPHTQNVSINLQPMAAAAKPAPRAALAALTDLGQALGMDDGPEILPAEEAYKLLAIVERGDLIRLQWAIAEGTYLYQDKMEVKLVGGEGVALGDFPLPEAEIKQDAIRPDGSIGDLPVYHDAVDLPIPLIRSETGAMEIQLLVAYQGCAEAGVCYPPIKQQVALALPAMDRTQAASAALVAAQNAVSDTLASTTAPPPAEQVAEQDRIAAVMAEGNMGLILTQFFVFGLLLAFTPCVFPMIPILSGIIAGQGKDITTRQAFVLSLIYVLAMSLTYTVAGVLAGLFGQNLQAAFQNPWILGTFALIFVLLAMSMFGFYELQLPTRWQSRLAELSNRQRGGTYTGVAIMGLLSALIVGPCVAPPLAGALIYIGQTGDAILGGLGLFALSMGMGAPLLVIGASAGKLLPKAGDWMNVIKAVFGIGLLAVAIILLERILPPAASMVLWGMLLITSAMYMGALRQLPVEASGWDRLWKGLGFVMLVYGALMLVGAAAGGKDTIQPLRGINFGSAGSQTAELHFKRIKTVSDLQREVQAASTAGRPVMLDFYADWCVSCKEMERYTFSDPDVIASLRDFVLLQADVTADDAEDKALLQGHFGLPGPPSIMFYGRDGAERRNYRVVGFMAADEFASHVRRAVQ